MTEYQTQLLRVLDRIATSLEQSPADDAVPAGCAHPAEAITADGTMGAVTYQCGECGEPITSAVYVSRQVGAAV